jgi:arsenate reductase
MAEYTIFHNPRCSKSRGALALLAEHGCDFEVVEYLQDPPSRATVQRIVELVGGDPAALVRTGDEGFKALGLAKTTLAAPAAVVDVLVNHPELLERPVVIRGDRAVLARPSERVLELF